VLSLGGSNSNSCTDKTETNINKYT